MSGFARTLAVGAAAATAIGLPVAMALAAAPRQTAATPAAAASRIVPADQHFLTSAAQGGMAEVKLGQLALQNAQSQAVKDFGQRMVTDHGKANDELKQLATSKGVTLPGDIGAKNQKVYDRLAKLSGAAFDKSYMSDMVRDHKKDVAEFQKESRSAHDAEVKSWAAKTLPTLQEHLKMAQEITHASRGRMSSPSSGAGAAAATPHP